MKLEQAKPLAEEIVSLISPHCERIHIAGSIRRECAEVGDIEIVCQPKPSHLNKLGMLLMDRYYRIRGKFHERQVRLRNVNPFIEIDLFLHRPHDYFRMLAIRTGSADFSHRVLANAWSRKGWCGTDDGLRRVDQCQKGKDKKWHCITGTPTLPPTWRDEEEFFKWLGLEWAEPRDRN